MSISQDFTLITYLLKSTEVKGIILFAYVKRQMTFQETLI